MSIHKPQNKNQLKQKIHFELIYQLHFEEELQHILDGLGKQHNAKESMKYQFQKNTQNLCINIHYTPTVIQIHFHYKGSPKQ